MLVTFVWSQVDVQQYVLGSRQGDKLLRRSRPQLDDKAVEALCLSSWPVQAAVVYHAQHAGLKAGALF